jgi:hypothetical protein
MLTSDRDRAPDLENAWILVMHAKRMTDNPGENLKKSWMRDREWENARILHGSISRSAHLQVTRLESDGDGDD